jgi:hypothetical protein
VKLALKIATQVTAGLAAVHKQKPVHRDIKQEGGAVTAKIIDLELAKAVNEPGSQTAGCAKRRTPRQPSSGKARRFLF